MPPFISAPCGAAVKGGDKQNADEIAERTLGNEVFKAQVSPSKTTLL